MTNSLCWTPLEHRLIETGSRLIFLISPFIQKQALKKIIHGIDDCRALQVITRWNESDIVSGVSDLEIFPYLKELGIPLYINSRIHLKLSVFEEDLAFHSSANITNRGLGIAPLSNIELGCKVKLDSNDWLQIAQLLQSSIKVDELIYEQASKYLTDHRHENAGLPKLIYRSKEESKEFSRHSLPFVQDPNLLWNYYSNDLFEGSRASFVHDLVLFSINEIGLEREDFFQKLETNFKSHPFIKAAAAFVRSEQELRFGSLNNWVTEKCTDKPVPFRWEMKPATNRLYDWLSHFFAEITWSRPKYSQVIKWQDSK
ncbi:hypothetical protein N9047_01505 [bacterium]|nr:hypothetical protein [bacterium]